MSNKKAIKNGLMIVRTLPAIGDRIEAKRVIGDGVTASGEVIAIGQKRSEIGEYDAIVIAHDNGRHYWYEVSTI